MNEALVYARRTIRHFFASYFIAIEKNGRRSWQFFLVWIFIFSAATGAYYWDQLITCRRENATF